MDMSDKKSKQQLPKSFELFAQIGINLSFMFCILQPGGIAQGRQCATCQCINGENKCMPKFCPPCQPVSIFSFVFCFMGYMFKSKDI